MLSAITERDDVRKAYETFHATMTRGMKGEKRHIGYRGGQSVGDVRWIDEEGYWCCLDEKEIPTNNRYWMSFGLVSREKARDPLIITTEINPPHEGTNRRCAGIFAQDIGGAVYLLHSGKIGGGKSGVGKATFLASLVAPNTHDVVWPKGTVTQALLIGRIDKPAIRRQVGEFVALVADFKSGTFPHFDTPKKEKESPYFDEFAGPRRAHVISARIESTCYHGPVISSLHQSLQSRQIGVICKDSMRDLFIHHNGRTAILFEAKTDVSRQNIYTGVGQLMLHSATASPPPLRVLILPSKPNAQISKDLAALGIEVMTYTLHGSEATFDNLPEILRKGKMD